MMVSYGESSISGCLHCDIPCKPTYLVRERSNVAILRFLL